MDSNLRIVKNAINSTLVVTVFNIFGKFAGVLKTLVIAASFGASAFLDSFWVAYLIPTMLPMVIRGALLTVFVPHYMKYSVGEGGEKYWDAANTLFTCVFIGIFLFTVFAYSYPAILINIFAPGLEEATHLKSIHLLRIMLVSSLFIAITSIVTAIANANHKFQSVSLEGVVTNLSIILYISVFSDGDIEAVAYGVVLGYFIYTILMIYAYRDLIGEGLRPCLSLGNKHFVASLYLMLPAIIGAVNGIAMGIIDNAFVSYLPTGSISILQYATMISMLPIEVIASSVITTFFPAITHYFSRHNMQDALKSYISGLRMLLFAMVPLSVVLILFSEHAVGFLFERGNFTRDNTLETMFVVICLSVGITGRSIAYFNFRIFHSISKSWMQVRLGVLQLLMNVFLNALLIGPLGINGIALATSISLTITACITIYLLQKEFETSIWSSLQKSLLNLIVMTISLVIAAKLWMQFVGFVLDGMSGVFFYFIAILGAVPSLVAFYIAGLVVKNDEVLLARGYLSDIKIKLFNKIIGK